MPVPQGNQAYAPQLIPDAAEISIYKYIFKGEVSELVHPENTHKIDPDRTSE